MRLVDTVCMSEHNAGMETKHALLIAAPPLALIAPVLGTMMALSQPVATLGPAVYLGGIAIIGLFLGAIMVVCHGRGRWGDLGAVLAGAATFVLLIDMMANGLSHISGTTAGKLVFTLGIVTVFAAALWLVRRRMHVILFVGAVALFASTLLVPPAQAREQSPSLIYIIMDEMIGVAGIDQSLPGGEQVHTELRNMLDRHGFRVYERAFSRHFFSQRSIPAMLAFDEHDDGVESRYLPSGEPNLRIVRDRVDAGQRVTFFQTAHIDFCSHLAGVDCRTFPSFDPTIWLRERDLASKLLATVNIMQNTHEDSSFLYRYNRFVRGFLDETPVMVPGHFDIHGFPEWFGRFEETIRGQEADAFFAHFLMPHAPSVMNPNCEPQPRWTSPYYLYEIMNLSGDELDTHRIQAYELYFDQALCAIRTLDGFLSRLAEMPQYEHATIVLHGDHGSRISAGRLAENLSDRDMIDNFSALYAIRGRGIDPGYDQRIISVQRLTADYFSGLTQDELGPVNRTVVLDTVAGDHVVLREMPDF